MAVQFILGRSGTGKTSYCIRGVVDALLASQDGRSLILLVPEQATYQAERAILSDKRIAGYNRLHVLSFDRLQFLLVGRNTARPRVSRIVRQMIVQRILRENQDCLKVFGSSANLPGMGRQMAETVCEMHRYAKTPDDIERLIGQLQKDEGNSASVLKFRDIGLILSRYLEFIEGRFVDPDIQLARACEAARSSPLIKGAGLWVDGFAGFTTAELAVLGELLRAAEQSRIALCLDPGVADLNKPETWRIDPVGLFSPTERTYADLMAIVREAKLPLADPVVLNTAVRFAGCPELGHVERHLFETKPRRMAAGAGIRIVSAPNERAEVRFVAREILNLVQQGYRYRDIAVIASDIDCYEHYIRSHFEECGLPFFIDKRRPLNRHPVVQLVCSALAAVTGGMGSGDVLAYLKTDLAPVERADVDRLENYCVAFGIRGGDWQSEKSWSFAGPDEREFDEKLVDEIRRKAVGPLIELRDGLYGEDGRGRLLSGEDFTKAIFGFLDVLGVGRTLARWMEQAQSCGDIVGVDEQGQFYGRFVDVFDELAEVFTGRTMPVEDYAAIAASAFSQLALALIPPTLDQVLVGSVERSRHPDLKAVFLVGATQKQFPVPVGSDSILSDVDRAAAESKDFGLAAAASRSLIERQYLAYIAFTRPSQFLCVTYPCIGEKGGAVVKSQFVSALESLFEGLRETSTGDERAGVESINSRADLADLLCSELGRDPRTPDAVDKGDLAKLLDDICSDGEFGELGLRVRESLDYDNRAELEGGLVERLYGRSLHSSATRLGTYAACPYQYFARYVLDLAERKEFKLEPLDLGSFYHSVLDRLLKRLHELELGFERASDERLLGILTEQIDELVSTDPFILNFSSHSPHNAFVIRSACEVLGDCVAAIGRMVRAGHLRPTASEVSFGRARRSKETLGEYELVLSDGRRVSLAGKIDRLDVAEVDGGRIAVVFDYKRRSRSFNWSRLYHGLDMQLPIYMLAVRDSAESTVRMAAGAFYMPIEVGPGGGRGDGLSGKAAAGRYKAKGIFDGRFWQALDTNASKDSSFYNFYVGKDGEPYGSYGSRGCLRPEDFERVLTFAENKVRGLAEEILSGRIEAAPYRLNRTSPCSHCRYRAVCRFDWQINDYRPLLSLGKLDVLERTGTSDV